ncbi:hypothetical protein SAMN04488535_1824 [Corynebacterium mycetoides]|uniref:Uncharacterized protein n=1 Tax=Corynebacterium mycetoides TaxID=38302 RepID=A0A1G9Q9V8_9CORY|nr:hypothetical protein [Corynebacterium mycetoides]SDM07844.1 hypothetical protein SAMN04488535_1824 [Corynebacterium mycetoides]
MSDDSQLTVADLLARAQKENPGSEQPRRRHRRSLDEGGVSVAELTGSLRKVDARPAESKHSSVPIDAPEPAAAKPEPASDAPTVTWTKFERPATPAAEPDATGELPKVPDAPAEPAAPAPEAEAEAHAEDATVNPILLVLFVFLGLVVGILGFLAFRWVWTQVPVAGAAAIALVATALIVFGVRALRTGRDGLTMTLAGIAGAVVTFGPALVTVL